MTHRISSNLESDCDDIVGCEEDMFVILGESFCWEGSFGALIGGVRNEAFINSILIKYITIINATLMGRVFNKQ